MGDLTAGGLPRQRQKGLVGADPGRCLPTPPSPDIPPFRIACDQHPKPLKSQHIAGQLFSNDGLLHLTH